MNPQEKFRQAKPLVMECLRTSKLARNDDQELIRQVWEKQGFVLTLEQYKFWPKLINGETIRRLRQKLQHDGFYKADKQTKLKRDLAAEAQQIFFRQERIKNQGLSPEEFNEKEYWNSMGKLVEIGRKALRKYETH